MKISVNKFGPITPRSMNRTGKMPVDQRIILLHPLLILATDQYHIVLPYYCYFSYFFVFS